MNTFAQRFAEALQRKTGNQSDLARHLGVTPQAVQRWLNGSAEPRADTLLDIAIYLNMTPQYLKFGTGEETAALALVAPCPAPSRSSPELIYADSEEITLLTAYRESTDTGKKQLLLSATMTEKKPAGKLPKLIRRH